MATARNSRGGIKKTGKNKSGGDSKVQGLANTLSKVSAQAKSLGINTAKADSMVAQTKREGSSSYKGSKEEKAFLASNIGTESPVIPNAPVPPNQGDMLGMNNASVLQEGLSLDGGQFVKDPTASDTMNATKEANMNLGNIANQMIGYLKPEENQAQNAYEDTYGITAKQAGRDFRAAQNEVQQYTSQLNSITSSRDAAVLALEDTGRGQTTGFIGGEQGRIQRQAAIAALPVQAQLAAAQGNLEIAKSHVDSLFQMKIKDIETEQAYKQTVANTWMSVANQQQSNLLNAAIADSNARADAKKTNLQMANQWAQQAYDNGQSGLAAKMMKLDQSSPTFQQDLANLQAQLVKPTVATSEWEMKDVNGVTSWVNKNTQEIKPIGDTTGKPVTLSYEDNAKFNSTPEAKAVKDATNYAEAVKNYKEAINTYGTGELFGKGKGALNEAYSSLVGATKDYYTLGTYDNGVQKLIALGIPEPELTGIKSSRISALDSAIGTAKDKIQRNVAQLEATRYGNSVEFKQLVDNASKVTGDADAKVINLDLFDSEDLSELQNFGINTQTINQTSTQSVSSYY